MPPTIFKLDSASGVPFYRQIINQILLAVGDGRLKPGAKLPTVRQLAVDLSINLNTVARAYREMEIRGLVETQQGTGTFVATRPELKSGRRRQALSQFVDQTVAGATSLGVSIEELIDSLIERSEKKERS